MRHWPPLCCKQLLQRREPLAELAAAQAALLAAMLTGGNLKSSRRWRGWMANARRGEGGMPERLQGRGAALPLGLPRIRSAMALTAPSQQRRQRGTALGRGRQMMKHRASLEPRLSPKLQRAVKQEAVQSAPARASLTCAPLQSRAGQSERAACRTWRERYARAQQAGPRLADAGVQQDIQQGSQQAG